MCDCDFYIVCKWLRDFLMFRACHLPSVHLLDGASSVSCTSPCSTCSTCSTWALVDSGRDIQQKKEANLRNLFFFLFFFVSSLSFSCLSWPPPSPTHTGVSSERGWTSVLWSVSVSDVPGLTPCTHSPPFAFSLRHCRCPILDKIKHYQQLNTHCKHRW